MHYEEVGVYCDPFVSTTASEFNSVFDVFVPPIFRLRVTGKGFDHGIGVHSDPFVTDSFVALRTRIKPSSRLLPETRLFASWVKLPHLQVTHAAHFR